MITIRGVVYVAFHNEIMNNLLWGIIEQGIECRCYDMNCLCVVDDEEESRKLLQFIKKSPTDIVFTHNFSPSVSNVCQELSIPYVAWTYDMPLLSFYNDSIYNSCNYIFSFDKYQEKYLKKIGIKNVYYMPLAANISRSMLTKISLNDEKKYSCDVSFIGNISFNNRQNLYEEYIEKNVSEELAVKINDIVQKICGMWDGKNIIYELLSQQMIEELSTIKEKTNPMEANHYFSTIISYHIASIERKQMLNDLLPFGVRLYSYADDVGIEGLSIHSALDYETELSKAYFLSKINMSSTLHCIPSGVPLRVFDILGMCSFCITNYQPEIEELFNIGKDIVVYKHLSEIPELVKYYLNNDDERMKIAASGFEKVKDNYNWSIGVKKIIKII